MTDDRDREVARRLGELDPPEHRPGFWADLRADLTDAATSTPSGPDAGPDLAETPDLAEQPDLVEPPDLVGDELDERRRRRARRPPAWLAAAAVTLVALVAGGLLLTGDDGGDDLGVTTDPTDPADPTDPVDPTDPTDPPDGTDDPVTAGTGPLGPAGDPVDRGSGLPLAVDPTGTFLYVADTDPDGGFGCEAGEAQALFVERVDGDGSDRQQAAPGVDATGGLEVRFGPDGGIALQPRCEGYGATVVVGRVGTDGTVVDPTELTVPDAEGIADLEFRAAGVIVASTHLGGEGGDGRRLVEISTDSGEIADLGPTDVVHIEVTADGRVVTAGTDGVLAVDGDRITRRPGVADLAVSPSGARAVVTDPEGGGLVLVDLNSGAETVLTGTAGATPGSLVVPADGVAVYAVVDGEAGRWEVRSVVLDPPVTGGPVLTAAVPWTEVVVTPDLGRLFLGVPAEDGSPRMAVREHPLTR